MIEIKSLQILGIFVGKKLSFAVLGDPTTTGGAVVEGASSVFCDSKPIALVGNKATCPSCKKGWGKICRTSTHEVKIENKYAALGGFVIECGCPLGANRILTPAGRFSFVGEESGMISMNLTQSAFLTSEDGTPLSSDQIMSSMTSANGAPSSAGQQAYAFTQQEWNNDLQKQAREYQWDTSQQENKSIAVLMVEEANEYFELLKKDTHDALSTGKNYTGVGMGLKGAYEVVKELGGLGVTAKAVNINGVMNIVIENYKPRYLDLGIRWQEATPQMLKIGYAMNTIKGNVSFFKGNVFIEIVFSGAVNSVDYMLHDEKTLGEVVGQFSADVTKGVVSGVVAQGFTLAIRGLATFVFSATLPAAIGLSVFVVAAFLVGNAISEMDDHHEYTKPMKEKIKAFIDES